MTADRGSAGPMRVMLVTPYLPHREVGHGGGVAIRGLLRYLARKHHVTLVSLVRPGEDPWLAEGTAWDIEVISIPFTDHAAKGLGRLGLLRRRVPALVRAVRSGFPLYAEKYWSREIVKAVIEASERVRPDVIQVEYVQLALLCRSLRAWRERAAGGAPEEPRPRLVLSSHEMASLPLRRRAGDHRWPPARAWLRQRARAWERLQRAATHWADITLCVTEQDRVLLSSGGGRGGVTVPLGVDTEQIRPVWEPKPPLRCLFVGSFAHRPNRAAAKFLIDKVWPQVSQYQLECQLVLAGRGSDALISGLGRADRRQVVALGFVEDLTPLYRECQLFVAPLTEGGGIKIKILEAMAHGIPVVTTPIGAEGIVDSAEDAAVIASPDAAFAESMIRALATPDALRQRAARARRIIEERFSWSTITERLTSVYGGR